MALLVYRQVFTNEDGSQGTLYLSTSDLSLTASSLRTLYQKRWKVEEYHKSLKSNASFAKSPTKRVRPQSNHFFASIVAFVKLETCRCATRLNHFTLKGKLYQAALVSAFAQLQVYKAACPKLDFVHCGFFRLHSRAFGQSAPSTPAGVLALPRVIDSRHNAESRAPPGSPFLGQPPSTDARPSTSSPSPYPHCQ